MKDSDSQPGHHPRNEPAPFTDAAARAMVLCLREVLRWAKARGIDLRAAAQAPVEQGAQGHSPSTG